MSCNKENNNIFRENKYQNISSQNSRKNNSSVSPNSSKYKKIGNYIILKTIGSGTFSTVKLGLHLPTHQKVAIKILDKNRIKDENDIKRISREIHILSKLYHPNIAQLYETIWSDRHIYIIMEYVEGNHLFNYINSLRKLNEIKASKLFVQLISCLEYIHILGIVHRDIKPENILLTKNKSKIKLVDFGLSNSYKYGTLLQTACGSPCYAPPEMISGKEYQPLYSDLWSCGVVLYCMLVGKLPFDDDDINILYKHIKSANFSLPNFLSNSAKDLLKKILNCNPNKRIRLEDIKKHPFYLMGEKNAYKNNFDKGILIGIEEIPVNEHIVKKMKKTYFKDNKKISEDYISNNIKNNCHNNITVIYYLMIKKLEEIKDNIHSRAKIKLLNVDNNINNININYINNTEFTPNNKIIKNYIPYKIKEKGEKREIHEIDNQSSINCNIEEETKREKNNILNINNIRKLIFNSNDISLKSKYNKERFNVVVINNILTETPQNKTLNIKSKYPNYTTNNSQEKRTLSSKTTIKRKMKSISNKKNLSRNDRSIYINIAKTKVDKDKDNKINLKKINYKFNDIRHIDINTDKSFNGKENKINNRKKNILSKMDNKTNRINNLKLLGLYSYNTTTIRQNNKYMKKILSTFGTKREIKNNNITLIKRKAYNSNPKTKKKNINIYINQDDLIKENKNQKNTIKNFSFNQNKGKNVKQKNTGGILRSLIGKNNCNSLKNDLKKKKSKISYSKSKSKDKNIINNNNIKVVLSLNDDCLNNKNIHNNKDINSIKNSIKLDRNHSCKNKDIKNNYKVKTINYNFSSSNIKKKKIHYISQIKPKIYIKKPNQNKSNFQNKK